MNQTLFQKITRLIFILLFIFSFNFQTNAQVEAKLNPLLSLWGVFQVGVEFPLKNNFSIEPEVVFLAIEENFGAGLIVHGKYYFNPDFGLDNFYFGFLVGRFEGKFDQFSGFGLEGGYKWVGVRNFLFEIGGGFAGISGDEPGIVPYGRLMFGYRFPQKKKRNKKTDLP